MEFGKKGKPRNGLQVDFAAIIFVDELSGPAHIPRNIQPGKMFIPDFEDLALVVKLVVDLFH